MTLLTEAQFREHVTTSLESAAVLRLLLDAENAITAYAGPVDEAIEYLQGSERLTTSRPIDEVTEVQERHGWTTPLALAADDYEQAGRFVLQRLRGGTNSAYTFRGPVRLTYIPVEDTPTRKIVQLELVKLEIAFNPALASETVGAWTQTYVSSGKSYQEQRADILSRLRETAGFAVVGG